jgi:hypothetical protein
MLALALVAAAVFAASASGGTLCKVYCKKGSSVQSQLDKASKPNVTATGAAPGAQLPFTGLDLGLVALAGVLLVAAGVGLHRVSRKPSDPPAA